MAAALSNSVELEAWLRPKLEALVATRFPRLAWTVEQALKRPCQWWLNTRESL